MTEGPVGAPAPAAAPPPEAPAPPAATAEAPPQAPPEVQEGGRFSINEDWAATIFGLVLLVLCLAGVITGKMIDIIPAFFEAAK